MRYSDDIVARLTSVAINYLISHTIDYSTSENDALSEADPEKIKELLAFANDSTAQNQTTVSSFAVLCGANEAWSKLESGLTDFTPTFTRARRNSMRAMNHMSLRKVDATHTVAVASNVSATMVETLRKCFGASTVDQANVLQNGVKAITPSLLVNLSKIFQFVTHGLEGHVVAVSQKSFTWIISLFWKEVQVPRMKENMGTSVTPNCEKDYKRGLLGAPAMEEVCFRQALFKVVDAFAGRYIVTALPWECRYN